MGEHRDHPAFAGAILARPVHVAVPQRDRFQAVQLRERRQVVLGRELRAPIGRQRQLGGGFAERQLAVPAVQRPARGCENDAAHATGARTLEQVEQADNVDVTVPHRVGHGDSDVDLGGVVIQEREPAGR